jgi:hypothetical protein
MKIGLDEFYKVVIDADGITRAILFAIEQPSNVAINEMIIRRTVQTGNFIFSCPIYTILWALFYCLKGL